MIKLSELSPNSYVFCNQQLLTKVEISAQVEQYRERARAGSSFYLALAYNPITTAEEVIDFLLQEESWKLPMEWKREMKEQIKEEDRQALQDVIDKILSQGYGSYRRGNQVEFDL